MPRAFCEAIRQPSALRRHLLSPPDPTQQLDLVLGRVDRLSRIVCLGLRIFRHRNLCRPLATSLAVGSRKADLIDPAFAFTVTLGTQKHILLRAVRDYRRNYRIGTGIALLRTVYRFVLRHSGYLQCNRFIWIAYIQDAHRHQIVPYGAAIASVPA
jgi:hypothetical protein